MSTRQGDDLRDHLLSRGVDDRHGVGGRLFRSLIDDVELTSVGQSEKLDQAGPQRDFGDDTPAWGVGHGYAVLVAQGNVAVASIRGEADMDRSLADGHSRDLGQVLDGDDGSGVAQDAAVDASRLCRDGYLDRRDDRAGRLGRCIDDRLVQESPGLPEYLARADGGRVSAGQPRRDPRPRAAVVAGLFALGCGGRIPPLQRLLLGPAAPADKPAAADDAAKTPVSKGATP